MKDGWAWVEVNINFVISSSTLDLEYKLPDLSEEDSLKLKRNSTEYFNYYTQDRRRT